MIPILIHTLLIPPGTKLEADHWNAVFENKKAAYLPERKETPGNEFCEFPEDGNFPEFGITGFTTTETVFLIEDATDFNPFSFGHRTLNSWAVEYINEGDNQEFSNNIRAIFEDIQRLLKPENKNQRPAAGSQKPQESPILKPELVWTTREEGGFNPDEKTPFPASILTLWRVHSSRDWESGIEEIDELSYQGPASVVIAPKIG